MLILTRKCGQSLIINNDIEVKVLEVKNKLVKLGVSAPKSITVDRKEIHRSKQLSVLLKNQEKSLAEE
jgi:carbon storage regulator